MDIKQWEGRFENIGIIYSPQENRCNKQKKTNRYKYLGVWFTESCMSKQLNEMNDKLNYMVKQKIIQMYR